jgi:hypothetical protein
MEIMKLLAPFLPLFFGLSSPIFHCREQAGGGVGHHGCDGSDPGSRISRSGVVAQGWAENIAYGQHSARAIVMVSSLMMACAVVVIAGTFSTPITVPPERLTVRMPDTAVFAASILSAATPGARSYAPVPPRRIRFNDATSVIGRDAADFALFRESVERMDRP